jgi:methylmalonyl-CoA mutase, N-terminal domain
MTVSYSGRSSKVPLRTTLSGIPIPDSVIPPQEEQPGVFPYTRGIYKNMYQGKVWTMRQFAGFGTPEDTNRRFHYLISQGQTGLSTAFDMPTLMGYDADHPRSLGEVGREGVSVSTIEDMDRLFAGIDLQAVTTSMTINCTAAPILAMYFALAQKRGHSISNLRGTIQNDILKEYIAQKEWISPPDPSLNVVCDMIGYCATNAPLFHPVSISGYHIREAGSNAVQELAFTLADGIAYIERCVERGLDVDSFAPRLSFFFDVHNDFFEEIAKLRAARRIWARTMKERFHAKLEKSWTLKTHAQTAGVTLTAQQPMNNISRVTLQALAAVFGGTQSLHTNSMDETLSLPTEEAVTVALRTQQIIAEESGVAAVADPLAGSYFVEYLTDEIERRALEYISEIDARGGMVQAINEGYPQKEIAQTSFEEQQAFERGERRVVGVNCFSDQNKQKVPTLKIDPKVETDQKEKVIAFKKARSAEDVLQALGRVRAACQSQNDMFATMINAVEVGVTVGEISDVFRDIFGVYRDPAVV